MQEDKEEGGREKECKKGDKILKREEGGGVRGKEVPARTRKGEKRERKSRGRRGK